MAHYLHAAAGEETVWSRNPTDCIQSFRVFQVMKIIDDVVAEMGNNIDMSKRLMLMAVFLFFFEGHTERRPEMCTHV